MRAAAFNLTARGLSHIDAEIQLVLADLAVRRIPNDLFPPLPNKLTDRCQFAKLGPSPPAKPCDAFRDKPGKLLDGPWDGWII